MGSSKGFGATAITDTAGMLLMLGFDQKAGTGTFQSGKMITDNEPTTSSDISAKKSASRWKRRLTRDAEPGTM